MMFTAHLVKFKHSTEESPWEDGLMVRIPDRINPDCEVILDNNLIPVPAPIWTYKDKVERGYAIFHTEN